MHLQNKQTNKQITPKTISSNDGTLASFPGLYKWHKTFCYPLVCKGGSCICAWRMSDSYWRTIKLQVLCKERKFSEMFWTYLPHHVQLWETQAVSQKVFHLHFLQSYWHSIKLPTSNPNLVGKSLLLPAHSHLITSYGSFHSGHAQGLYTLTVSACRQANKHSEYSESVKCLRCSLTVLVFF